jgi:unsaturated rhamnogalacturonyl hydrolase
MPQSIHESISLSWCKRYRPESQSTDWGQSLAMYGLLSSLKHHNNPEVREYLRRWIHFHLNEQVHVNYFCGSWSFGLLYPEIVKEFPEVKMQLDETAKRIYDFIMRKALRNGDGVILHNIDLPNIYIDTVYYSLVILAKLGSYLKLPWEEEAMNQLRLHLEILKDGKKPFYIHCEVNAGGLRSEGSWARGNGWVMMTCAEILSIPGISRKTRKECESIFYDLAKNLAKLQTKNGLWRTILDDKSAYEETSASAMYLFAYSRAKNLKLFGSKFDKIIKNASEGLIKYVDKDYRFTGVSEGTWPGTIEYYKSLSQGEWWWGTGAYLLAISEFM